MTKEQIYNAVCDMAEDASVSPEQLIASLLSENEDLFEKSLGTLSDTARDYVKKARAEKAATREGRRKSERESRLSEDIKRFRTLFPDVKAENIPECVWADVESGIPLPHAYALYVLAGDGNRAYAEAVNDRNGKKAPPPVTEGADEGEFSMEEVANMSSAAVKKNFPKILRSIAKWKLR